MKSAKIIAATLVFVFLAITMYSYAAEPGSSGDPIALKSYVDSKIAALEAKLTGTAPRSAQTGAAGPSGGAATGAGGSSPTDGASGVASNADSMQSRISALEKSIEKLTDENESLRRSIRQTAASLGNYGDGVANAGDIIGAGGGGADTGTGGVGSGGGGGAGASGAAETFIALEVLADQRIILGAGAEFILRTGKALAIRGELGALVDLITGKDLDAGAGVPINHLILSPRDDNRGVKISEDAWVLIKGRYALR